MQYDTMHGINVNAIQREIRLCTAQILICKILHETQIRYFTFKLRQTMIRVLRVHLGLAKSYADVRQ